MDLSALIAKIRNYPGLTRKQPIREVFEKLILDQSFGPQLPNYGDDAAVIPWKEDYLLLAADGIMPQLLINEPYAAGKAAVMVSVNDIYSMGGRPIAMVNVLAYGDQNRRSEVVEGIRKGCQKLRVPMVGGHLHPDAPASAPSLSVAILGSAKKVLRSHLAEEGDDLVLAVDLQGTKGLSVGGQLGCQFGKDLGRTPLSPGSLAADCRKAMGLRGQGHQQCRHIGHNLHHDGEFRERGRHQPFLYSRTGRDRSFRLADRLSKFQFYSLGPNGQFIPGV